MMIIRKIICDKSEILEKTKLSISTYFNVPDNFSNLSVNRLKPIIDELVDNVHVIIESPYIDKVYRDSYYGYFSSKSQNYSRDCIRISFFNGPIVEADFRNEERINELKNEYLGFIVIRPTLPNIIGRTVLNPRAFRNNNVFITSTKAAASVDSIKFTAEGFPWSSQDTETISCAETTLWSVMEYFGTKYAEYRPILPTKLIDTLKKVSTERQIPSKGLNLQQMSFALKEFGFGSRIYHKTQYINDFNSIIGSYVEGGIPVILALEGGNIRHACLCIGQKEILDSSIDSLSEKKISLKNISDNLVAKKIKIFDYQEIERDFVLIDDNRPPYEKAMLSSPCQGYPSSEWHSVGITAIIIPLHTKIYLEAYEAKNFAINMISQIHKANANEEEIMIRTFLCSNRSFKHALAINSDMDANVRDILLEHSLPKFLWIVEITDKDLIKRKKARGLIIIDATEASTMLLDPLVVYINNGELISFDPTTNALLRNPLTLNEFTIFDHNLTHY